MRVVCALCALCANAPALTVIRDLPVFVPSRISALCPQKVRDIYGRDNSDSSERCMKLIESMDEGKSLTGSLYNNEAVTRIDSMAIVLIALASTCTRHQYYGCMKRVEWRDASSQYLNSPLPPSPLSPSARACSFQIPRYVQMARGRLRCRSSSRP